LSCVMGGLSLLVPSHKPRQVLWRLMLTLGRREDYTGGLGGEMRTSRTMCCLVTAQRSTFEVCARLTHISN